MVLRALRAGLLATVALYAPVPPLAAGPDARARLTDGEQALRVGDLATAMQAFRDALDQDPASWQALDGIGRTLRAGGDAEAAERELRRAVEVAPDPAIPARHLLELVLSLPAPSRRQDGLAWIAEHAGGATLVQMMVARTARREGDFVTAAAALEQVRRVQPESKEAWVEQILLRRDALDYEDAERLALAFIERHPTYHQTHVQLGRIYYLQGRTAEAELQYRRALELRPDEPTALIRLGEIRLQAGDLPEAQALLERATIVQGDAYMAYYLLGRVHLQRGDRAAADEAMSRFREIKDRMRATARLAGGAAMEDE